MSTELPLVSIVAICYNQARFAVETLESISNQTYPNIQLIIIDDCSTDNSVEVIQNWVDEHKIRCEFVIHPENLGVTKTCNDGLSRVKGKYYQLIACDDLILKNKNWDQVQMLEGDKKLGAIFSNCMLIDEDGKITGEFFKDYIKYKPTSYSEQIKFPAILEKNYLHPVSGLIKTKIAREIGQYDEDLFAEDWDFSIRLCLKTKVLIVNKCMAQYRVMSDSMNHLNANRHKAIESAIKSFLKYRRKMDSVDLQIKKQVLAYTYLLIKTKAPNRNQWIIKTFIIYPSWLTLKRLKVLLVN